MCATPAGTQEAGVRQGHDKDLAFQCQGAGVRKSRHRIVQILTVAESAGEKHKRVCVQMDTNGRESAMDCVVQPCFGKAVVFGVSLEREKVVSPVIGMFQG